VDLMAIWVKSRRLQRPTRAKGNAHVDRDRSHFAAAVFGRVLSRTGVSGPSRIEGYAIISADGMIADANRQIPDALKIEADQKFFHGSLERAVASVHGRHSHEGGPHAARRHRLIVTRKIAAVARDPSQPKALLWNPQGASLEQAWLALGAPDGMLGVIGGTDVYQLFLEIGYDAFHLTRVPVIRLPGGRPVFPEIPDRTPEDVLASHRLRPGPQLMLDQAAGVTLVTWAR
jgi:dihydrofolate reductase